MAPVRRRLGLLVVLAVLAVASSAAPQDATKHVLTSKLSLDEIDSQLQVRRVSLF